MGLGTVEVGDGFGCCGGRGWMSAGHGHVTGGGVLEEHALVLPSPPVSSPPLPSHASGQLRGVRLRVAQQRRADVHLAGREGAVGGPGLALATPRLDDRSPTAVKVQGPVRVGERCESERQVVCSARSSGAAASRSAALEI